MVKKRKTIAQLQEELTEHWEELKEKIIEALEPKVKRLLKFLSREYRIVQYTNQLTEETYFFIEERVLWWWSEVKIKNPVYQQKFGCDRDGMFGLYENAEKVLRFYQGEIRIVKKIRE